MNFDWTKPMIIDWSGRHGPLISEEDIKNSVLKRILRNQYCPPLCEREIVRVKPWWSPQQPFGINAVINPECRYTRFVPGLHNVPAYPQLSTLTKQQHQHGLRVLAAEYDVQPRNYPHPTRKDYKIFAEIKELYEIEQKEFIKWAKQCWINGDCIRALRPKPIIEKVYDAEFKMRASAVHSLPQKYALAAQIPLETRSSAYEMEHKQDLISVDVQDLPVIDYPEEMDRDFSILQPCLVPEPCSEHPCKFVLPNEDSVSVLPLTEIHRELAQYAIENGASFVASENALHCLIQTERSWKLPISVVEVICPENGDVKNVVVLGSEFEVRKDCATQRTYKAYKHLLHQGFIPSKCNYKIKSTKQTSETNTPKGTIELNAQPLDSFLSLDDDLDVSSDSEERLEIDDHDLKTKPDKPCEPESNSDADDIMVDVSESNPEPYCQDARHSYSDKEPSSEPDRLTMDAADETNTQDSRQSYSLNEPDSESDMVTIDDICENKNNESRPGFSIDIPDWLTIDDHDENTNKDFRPSYSFNEASSKLDKRAIEDICESNSELCNQESRNKSNFDSTAKAKPSYSNKESSSESDELMIDDVDETNPETCYPESDKPNYSHSHKARPSYRKNEPSNEVDELMIDDVDETNPEPCYTQDTYEPNYSIVTSVPKNTETWLNLDSYEPDFNYDNIERPSYSNSENSCKSGKLTNSNETCHTSFKAGYYQDYNKTINTEDIPRYSQNEAKLLVDEARTSPPIKISTTKSMNQNSPGDSTQITREVSPVKSCSVTMRNSISEMEPTSKSISTDSFKSGKQIITNSSEDEVFEPITIKKTNELSPVKPCSVSVEVLNIETIKKIIIGENKSMIKPSEVNKTVSSLRKQSSGETSNDISRNKEGNTNTGTDLVRKPISENENNNPDNFEHTKIATKQVSPIKPCIKKPNIERSPKISNLNSKTNQEINIDCYPVNDSNNERLRRLSDQIYQEHDYCKDTQFSPGSNNSSPGKLTIDDTNKSHNNTSRKPGVRKLSFNEVIIESTKIGTSNQLDKPGLKNVESKTKTVETNAEKMSIKDLFGDESDSDEPICRLAVSKPAGNHIGDSSLKIPEPTRKSEVSKENLDSNKAIEHQTRKLSFSDPISLMTDNLEKSPLKPCLKSPGFSDSSPRNSKRKLSFSDPLTSDPEFMSFSEPDSDLPIVGFDNGVAVLSNEQPKCNKKQNYTIKCSYSLRSKIKPAKSAKRTKISKTTKQPLKETGGFTKIVPQNKHKRTIALRSRRVSAQTNSDYDSDCSQNSENMPINEYINILKTGNVSLRRSLRNTSRLNSENSEVSLTNENTNVSVRNTLQISGAKVLRRSSRLSVRSTKENIQPKINQASPKFNEKTMNTNSFSKITKKGRNRRMSLPANIFSHTDRMNQGSRSKSMTNLNEIANKKILQKVPLSKSLSNSTSSLNTKDTTTLSTLELTERTIRYFRRSYNSICSETERSEGEMSERTKRYIRRSVSSACSEAEKSDGEMKRRTKKYTRRISSTTPSTRMTNNLTGTSDSINQNKELSERTKRYMNRSISFAYSSCDETDEPMPIRRKKTKRDSEAINTKVDATNKILTSVMETNKINQSNSIQLKTKAMDITANNESIETVTSQVGELNKMDVCEANNEEMIEVFNILNFKATTEMDLSESSDDEMLQCNSSSHVNNASFTEANQTNKRRSISESSDNSDNYFDSNETEEFNIFHFTATNATDSEEESEIDSMNDSTEELITVIEIADEDDDVSMREEIPIQLENIKTCDISTTEITQTEDKKNKTNNVIETEVEQNKNENSHISNKCSENQKKTPVKKSAPSKENVGGYIGIHTCTCKDTQFAVPPPRSFKRWLVRNKTSNITFNLMVHASHKARKGNREVILEPIVEYQPELGGVRQTEGRLRAIALSLMLREPALLMNVRVDHENGNVVAVEKLTSSSFVERHAARTGELAGVLHVALDQLRYLRPGRYVLAHDSCHGSNAMLYTTRGAADAASLSLSVREDSINMPDAEDALFAKIPPELGPVLLPFHKHRSILPLAFTPFKNQVREDKRALARAKHPPPAIQWPKKKKKSKKNGTGRPPRTDVEP